MKTDIHLQVIPTPSAQDREHALSFAIEWHRTGGATVSDVLDTAARFARFIANSALPVPAPVERGPAHDPPPGLS